MSNKFTEYNLPTDAYAAFDATSLKQLIVDRLTEKGVFTDQIYEGSNMSSIIDVIAYSYHVLLFYLNRTANESMFSQSEIYENMNRIVKLINYKPLGYQTSVLPFTMTAEKTLAKGVYTIPRYSFIEANGIPFSFSTDVSFTKSNQINELISSVGEGNTLHQGKYIEYPTLPATGEPFESFTITLADIKIDHGTIDVYVRNARTGSFNQYTEVTSLYFSDANDTVYEKRYNENGRYELTFGNNINGNQLNLGDEVHVLYLKSSGAVGEVGPGALAGCPLTLFTSVNFNRIRNDIKPVNISYMSFEDASKLKFLNTTTSTAPAEPEEISTIRQYAPEFFKAQNPLVTSDDYEVYISRHHSNILNDVKAVSNAQYIDGHLRYLDEVLGLNTPTLESRALYNQVKYADANNFNNVHVYAVPKITKNTSANVQANFLAPGSKEAIRNNLQSVKMITDEPVFQDPVYMAVGFGITQPKESISVDVVNKTKLIVERSATAKKNADELKSQAFTIVSDTFSHSNSRLGQVIDISAITSAILSLEGVQSVYMTRTDAPTLKITGVSMLVWNPVYPVSDIEIVNQNIILPYFKYPYIFDSAGLLELIEVTQALS
jgi:hypothetical protein